jgi:hypothetical protein
MLGSMALTIISSLTDKKSPWVTFANLIQKLRGLPIEPSPTHTTDHLLLITVLIIMGITLGYFYKNWPQWHGALSEADSQRLAVQKPHPLLVAGLEEAQRIIERRQAPTPHEHANRTVEIRRLEPPEESLAWEFQARDLICLTHQSFAIDRATAWHPEARCWIGFHRHTRQVVAIRCAHEDMGMRLRRDS